MTVAAIVIAILVGWCAVAGLLYAEATRHFAEAARCYCSGLPQSGAREQAIGRRRRRAADRMLLNLPGGTDGPHA